MDLSELILWLETLSHQIPLELFTFLGTLIEEIVAPIPSPLVMTLAGSIAHAQRQTLFNLAFLALLGGIGKTLGSWVLYYVADRLEDIIVPKFGRFLGVTHKDIESVGKRLDSSWRDDLFIFASRALPIIPSAPVSIACGILKINIRTYLLNTFLGTLVRNVFYLYLGYMGVESYQSLIGGLDKFETVVQLFILLILAIGITWAYSKKEKTLRQWCTIVFLKHRHHRDKWGVADHTGVEPFHSLECK